MSEDERLAKIKDLLDSTVAEFESVFKSAGTFDQSQVGNGWAPSSIPVQTYVIDPMPFDEAMKFAESRKTRAFGPVGWLRLRSGRVQLVGNPTLVFFPYWRVKGYHECFYFRGKTYTAYVPDDVIAVQIGGRMRALTSQFKTDRSIVDRARNVLKRTLAARSEPRYFTVDSAIELARQFNDASLLVDGEGKEDVSMEYLLEKRPRMHRLEEDREPSAQKPAVKFAPLALKAEEVVRMLHAKLVKPPPVFNRILANRFEVTELTLLELPIYVFTFRFGKGVTYTRTLYVNGVTLEMTVEKGKFPFYNQQWRHRDASERSESSEREPRT